MRLKFGKGHVLKKSIFISCCFFAVFVFTRVFKNDNSPPSVPCCQVLPSFVKLDCRQRVGWDCYLGLEVLAVGRQMLGLSAKIHQHLWKYNSLLWKKSALNKGGPLTIRNNCIALRGFSKTLCQQQSWWRCPRLGGVICHERWGSLKLETLVLKLCWSCYL